MTHALTILGYACFLWLSTALSDDAVRTKHTLTLDGAKKAGDAAAADAQQKRRRIEQNGLTTILGDRY